MTEHAWVIERFDAGPLGECESWQCPTCGVCGGPVWPKRGGGHEGRWPAFIPGPARKVSEDCEEAQVQIRSHLEERIVEMRKRWCAPQAEAIAEALRSSPEVKNVIAVVGLIFDIVNPMEKGYCMPVAEVRERLKAAGLTSVV